MVGLGMFEGNAVTDERAQSRSTLPLFRIQQEYKAVTRLSNVK